MKKKKKSGTLGTIIFMVILVALIFGCFFLAQKKSKERAEEQAKLEAQQTEAEKLIMMDIEQKYPVTAREVIKLYNRILQCVHNDDVTDAEVKALAGQLRCLFDDEFFAAELHSFTGGTGGSQKFKIFHRKVAFFQRFDHFDPDRTGSTGHGDVVGFRHLSIFPFLKILTLSSAIKSKPIK